MRVFFRIVGAIAVNGFLLASAGTALAQTVLPEIVVTAPSPILRAAPQRPERGPSDAVAAATPQVRFLGALPIVADQFATVTVVPTEELRRSVGATLGDLLFAKPGITGSTFAPGAASRPIVRGLDVNRVGIIENGLGGGGVSDLGEDHFVPIDPLSSRQIEVIRGPATLRYGSQSIGGVVSTTNNRIPERPPCTAADGTRTRSPCISVETMGAVSTGDRGREGAVLIDAGAGNFAIHADAFRRGASDYRIPHYPYVTPPDPAEAPGATQPDAFNAKQPNSAARAAGHSLGGSYVTERGFVGIAVSQNTGLYRIPGIEAETHGARIDARQTKVMSKGEVRNPHGAIDAVRFWIGHTDYTHHERALADAFDSWSDGIRQTFTSKENEGRVEFQFSPLDTRWGFLTTALGIQAGHQRLTASSPDDPDSPLNGLFDPNRNSRIAGYAFTELAFSPRTKAQLAGRIEHVSLDGSVPASIPDVFDISVDPASIGPDMQQSRRYTPASVSVGVIHNLPLGLALGLSLQRVERAPKPAELFSRGPHEATATFDIGDPSLKIETATSIEASLRRSSGPFRFELTGFHTRFNGFIYRNLTGATCDEGACVAANDPNPLELSQARYMQRDAVFRGVEFQSQFDVAPLGTGVWGIENQLDVVRATFTDGSNVPRIPPVRLGGGLFWRSPEWLARVNLLHAFAQNDIAAIETRTGSYNFLKAEISHTRTVKAAGFTPQEVTVGLAATNLLNDDIRNHVSFNKEEVLLPGRAVRAFATVRF